jgi:hypothetical protein
MPHNLSPENICSYIIATFFPPVNMNSSPAGQVIIRQQQKKSV